jgi:hypothetical protein
VERDSTEGRRFPLRPSHLVKGTQKGPGWKKSHDGGRRGLDSKTLSALQTPSLDHLTATAGAHAAQESVNLLILTVMRLERALQPEHPLTANKDTRGLYRTRHGKSSNPTCDLSTGRGWITAFHTQPDLWTTLPRTWRDRPCVPNVHTQVIPLSPPLGIPIHRLSTRKKELIPRAPYLFPMINRGWGQPSPMLVDNFFRLCYDVACSPSASTARGGRHRLKSFYAQVVDSLVYNVLILCG